MKSFTIFPTLGRRSDVSPDGNQCFVFPNPDNPGLAYTYDVGGINYSVQRERGSISKSLGKAKWSSNGLDGICNGMFELYDGDLYRERFVGKGETTGYMLVYTEALHQRIALTTPASLGGGEALSFIRVGKYAVFTDQATTTPYKWKHGDSTTASKLITAPTEYKFRYLAKFQRRVFGLYSDQTDGNIEIRWGTAWPDTVITSMTFPAANQMYIPNDDTITGGATMGINRLFIYCEDSTQLITYYPDYDAPFRIYTVAPQQGFATHNSIINLGNRHYGFNKNYGFCEYRGGDTFTPISAKIEPDIADIDPAHYSKIVGTHLPVERTLAWTVPLKGSADNSHILFYHLDSKQWSIDDKVTSCIDTWYTSSYLDWGDLALTWNGDVYNSAKWNEAPDGETWQAYSGVRNRLIMAGDHKRTSASAGFESAHIYVSTSEDLLGTGAGKSISPIDAYRVEPIMSFGNPRRFDLLTEVWFSITKKHKSTIDVYHRCGDTAGEVKAQDWTSVGSISCDSPDRPVVHVEKNARLHQIKWGTNAVTETFRVNRITFKYEEGSNG